MNSALLNLVLQAALRAAKDCDDHALSGEIKESLDYLRKVDVPEALLGVVEVVGASFPHLATHDALTQYAEAKIESAATGKGTKGFTAARLGLSVRPPAPSSTRHPGT